MPCAFVVIKNWSYNYSVTATSMEILEGQPELCCRVGVPAGIPHRTKHVKAVVVKMQWRPGKAEVPSIHIAQWGKLKQCAELAHRKRLPSAQHRDGAIQALGSPHAAITEHGGQIWSSKISRPPSWVFVLLWTNPSCSPISSF
jgi:hypothetical protein